ncbi:MAG TPA: hypothetical protein VKI00_14570 [Mycobacterium sp.]|uniref:hypothetical protein n=1 Tax=Mycobacterium sp. TaxID=1785 RepID=UPI002CD82567|nr:hypothetical protein [Mycobacterium sp.]HME76818.1 hypothetical protein [Mycobacterium sp.]
MTKLTWLAGGALTAALGSSALLAAGTASAATPSCDEHQDVVTTIETQDSAATICSWRGDGRLEYRGVNKNSGDSITIPVTLVVKQASHPGYCYTAVNNGYTYRVDQGTGLAIIDPDGSLISYEHAL